MARATWKGFITFGLVNIPVLLYSGERRAELQFELLDSRDQSRIRYRRVNEDTGEEVPWDQIVRAYEYSNGNYVMLNETDFERASIQANKSISVESFVDRGVIEPYFFEKPYVVVPQPGGEKSYVLLREAMQGAGKMGLARAVIRGRQYLLVLMPEGQAIMAERLRFAQEMVDPQQFNLPTGTLRELGVNAEELDMAERLVLALSDEWDPSRFHDEYRDALMDWIQKKVRTGQGLVEPEEVTEEPLADPTEDLVELLQRSLRESSSRRRDADGG